MLTGLAPESLWLAALIGVLLDAWLGEPRRWHPLVGFGRIASGVQAWLNTEETRDKPFSAMVRGTWAWSIMLVVPVLLAWALTWLPGWSGILWQALALYAALGARSLREHVMPIARALSEGDLPQARALTARIVSRDTEDASASDIARAAVESTLENGNDAIFGALFWFAIAGAPGVVLFRLANTLDAMWGYRTDKFLYFGRPAARIDDLLNWIPARLTAASYAIFGDMSRAIVCWRTQAKAWSSPNAGPVMAAGAGSLGVQLGGPARYQGEWETRPELGCGMAPSAQHIKAAWRLISRSMWMWLIVSGALALFAASQVDTLPTGVM
ncbi:adenosylcobinamide-phosphate synthase CbiB [Pandoraea pulmonicola]|uniref:Cobalamin biosynthesis protein CobD n=1 Tax=Pandoraea pulmonicola TaxID=93221 RepID=A0AAJ4ZAG9_PANPU|nr:adenosylcobinamide-phosphate synthase CbiB [Pandoraea pulmonicola]AJC21507.1 cobalamin biosynthesis protein [Pandoraea pulmonicola]SUA89711.1 cobalamin biosynthesis protein [Pandoraea pulmonicola]